MKIRISILDNIYLLPEAQTKLQRLASNKLTFPKDKEISENKLVDRTNNAEAILVSPWCKITSSYLKSCSSLNYVGLCGTSTTNIDLEAVKKRNIIFTNVIDYGDEPAAEYMFMLLLKLARGDGKYQWREFPCELMGKSIGIIGLGALGKTIAYLALGFKMNVYYYSLHREKAWEARGISYKDKKTLLKICDVVVISTPSDIKVLGKKEFDIMKQNSILMYVSGGEALDEKAFLDWIGKDNNYALFNYSTGERYYKLFKNLPRIIFPKVIAGHTLETKERLGQIVVNNLKGYINNKK